MNETGIIRCDYISYGTLVCNVITLKKIYLFSDGRVNNKGKIISDEHSKVHQITKFTGMLTAGMYIKQLITITSNECKKKNLIFAEDVIQIAALVIREIWNNNLELMERREKDENMKIFAFVSGYSKEKVPKLYYLDSNSRPRFVINERILFRGGKEIEIGSIVSDDTSQESSDLMMKNIVQLRKRIQAKKVGKKKLSKIFRSAFDATKKQINSENNLVGGKTFTGTIDPLFGFQYS